MITPYIRYTELSERARDIAKSGEYLYYAQINYSCITNEYFSPHLYFRDPETGRTNLSPRQKLDIKKKITIECLEYAKRIYEELRTFAPEGRLKALSWAKHQRFFQNNDFYTAYRESEDYIYETRVYFSDEAVACIYCYMKEKQM